MHVKICGMTTREAAQEAAEAGADFIGFVFAPSKRQITPKKAAEISAGLPSSVKKVGVFVNETKETIIQTAETAGLDIIQLHGDEPALFAEALPYPVIKAFRMGKHDIAEIQAYPCDYYLIDSPKGPNRGGNGTTFDWARLTDAGLNTEKLILAGGLTPENVQSAISIAKPAAVDVSSGVETNGEKDLEKISQFIHNAKMKG
ncbi:phosphoribosylanthranilate isomerase [Lentibacillus persicus]|uniref:N-(5'-phosphoribosyl)anthranilate isomerase n=1 Tax=Lentibacillus persicus TaxID=640948 RepID=A0A1I1Y8U6_9BACI|nr:phosphoribosylanthranilate isomerase [Lentibacillus persicus]SFE15984.1 phosphoribosylanthranilate isomerase [Lentibacillus persicus]